ncbi:MAG: amidase [Calditrichaeota bacterium]|nr:amidase [Calditrichota bacterium]
MANAKKTVKWVLLIIGIAALGLSIALNIYVLTGGKNLTRYHVAAAEKIIGLKFSGKERAQMLPMLRRNLSKYKQMRATKIDNSLSPAILFQPIPPGKNIPIKQGIFVTPTLPKISAPKNIDNLAFATIPELAYLIRTRQITSLELTKMCIARLKKYGPQLECTITLTEDLALQQARRADAEIAAGKYRGLLHGIPFGAKDLLAVKGYKTTWGAEPYKNQMIDVDATVIKKLRDAGAVLVAKLTLGALAMGDVWFGGKTRNPWDITRGSSGSSAGPASAVAAGLVPFAIGTETWGSIVSPSTVCGVTGLRPTFGRVSRYGAMALSWTMDKIGPICRSAEDCAIVFNSIIGGDGQDLTVVDFPFPYNPDIDISKLRIGYLKNDFDANYRFKKSDSLALETLKKMGAKLVPIKLPDVPYSSISFILSAEAAAAFDELTRSNQDDLMKRQSGNAWPNTFRASRFIPAVEYINANRIRTRLISEMADLMKNVDLYVAPSFKGGNLLVTNLTGHPCVVVPNGFSKKNLPTSFCFVGQLYDEATILAVAHQFQQATDFHKKHPAMDWVNE